MDYKGNSFEPSADCERQSKHSVLAIGDFNARVGNGNTDGDRIMGEIWNSHYADYVEYVMIMTLRLWGLSSNIEQ